MPYNADKRMLSSTLAAFAGPVLIMQPLKPEHLLWPVLIVGLYSVR